MGSPRNLIDSPVLNRRFGNCRVRPRDTATSICGGRSTALPLISRRRLCRRVEGEPDEGQHSHLRVNPRAGPCRHFLVNLPATNSDTQPNKAPMMIEAIVGTIASAGDRGFNRISPATDAKP